MTTPHHTESSTGTAQARTDTKPKPRTDPEQRRGRPSLTAPGAITPQRQVRIPDEDWYGGAELAAEQGLTISEVTRRLVRAWRLGLIDLPD